MSYKHNNLMAIRQNYWNDNISNNVLTEKKFLQNLLNDQHIYSNASSEDAKYLFFSLPSIIIVKGYSLGFQHDQVKTLILEFIAKNKDVLKSKSISKIQYRM
jgi:hypothetical protein